MSDMEVDHILEICSLDTDGEWVRGMKGECHESPGLRRRVASLHPGVDLELEQPALPAIEPDGVLPASLGSLHDRDPLVVVGEEREVQKRGWGVGLGGDR